MLNSLRTKRCASGLMFLASALVSNMAWSMDALSDSQLATTTGQDGLSISILPPAVTALASGQTRGFVIDAAVLHDKDGFTGLGPAGAVAFTTAGALVFGDASKSNALNAVGTKMGVYGSNAIGLTVDASGGGAASAISGAAPVLNLAITLPTDFLLRTGDVSVGVSGRAGIAVGAAGATIANASIGKTTGAAYKILNSMDIGLNGITITMQLGNTPQGAMLKFNSFNIANVNFNNTKFSLASPNTGGTASQLTFDPVVSNLNLTGSTVDFASNLASAVPGTCTTTCFAATGGILFQDASATVGTITMNNLTAGTAGASTSFAGMANAPLGSFGATTVVVSNLKIGISGL